MAGPWILDSIWQMGPGGVGIFKPAFLAGMGYCFRWFLPGPQIFLDSCDFIFNDIYNLVENNCENIFDHIKDEDFENLDTYLETYYDKKTSKIIKKLIKENRTVYIGQFNDFEPPIGVYLCKTSFNICDDNIFFSSQDASY